MLLEIRAQVEQRFRQNVAFAKQQRNQEPADSAVAIAKRVDGFKLVMQQREINQERPLRGGLQKPLERLKGLRHLRYRRRYKSGFLDRSAPTSHILLPSAR